MESVNQNVPTLDTRDFDFVVTLMALPESEIRVGIVGMKEFKYEGAKESQKDKRVTMCLAGIDMSGNYYDAREELEQLRLRYVNDELLVSPKRFISAQRGLRPMIIDGTNKKQNEELRNVR